MIQKLKTRSAIPYFGSDSEVAKDLATKLDHCKHVTIPFVGGGAIIPHLKARGIIANDLNSQLITYYRVISGTYGEASRSLLIDRCQRTLSHPDELLSAKQILERPTTHDVATLAWAYWSLCWIGRKGMGGTKREAAGSKPSVRRKADGGNNASRLMAAKEDLEIWAEHFERCEFCEEDFRTLIPKIADHFDCAVYVDPPWVGAGEVYKRSFDRGCHVDLRDALDRFERTTVLVRYGDDEWVRELYSDWFITEVQTRNQANNDIGEVWFMNTLPHEL